MEKISDNFNREVEIEDGSEFGFSSEAGIKEISLEHFRKCVIEGSKEMTRGGVSEKVINGKRIEVEIPNQREIFINSVKLLHTILLSELFKKKDYLKEIQGLDSDIIKIEQKCNIEIGKLNKGYKTNKSIDYDKNFDRFSDSMEKQIISTTHKKLMVLSLLLAHLNYFKEGSAGN